MSVSVRYSRGSWVVDVSTKEGGKRKRDITAFGAGAKAKAAAEAYRDDIALDVKSGKFWQRRAMNFRDLWTLFDAQLVGPVPGPATIQDYRSVAANYLLPALGSTLVNDIDAQTIIDLRTQLLTNPGIKSAVTKGSHEPLAARTVSPKRAQEVLAMRTCGQR